MKKLWGLMWLGSMLIFALPQAQAGSPSIPIEVGDEVQGTLTADMTIVTYSLAVEANTTVTIRLSSRQFDPTLTLLNPDSQSLATNDDYQGSLNAQIDNIVLTEAGTYFIVVGSSDGDETGDYTLTVTGLMLPQVQYGEAVVGAVSPDQPSISYYFEARFDEEFMISAESDEFDVYLELYPYPTRDYALITSDNEGIGSNAFIARYHAIDITQFIVVVKANPYTDRTNQAGEFTLRVEKIALPPLLTCNEVSTATFTTDDLAHYYRFEPRFGQEFYMRAVAEDTSNDLELLFYTASSPYAFAFDDDGGAGTNPELGPIILRETTRGLIVVKPAQVLNADGNYQIELVCPRMAEAILEETVQLQFNDKNYQEIVQVAVDAGQEYLVTLTAFSPSEYIAIDFYLNERYSDSAQIEQLAIGDEWQYTFTPSNDGVFAIFFATGSNRTIRVEVTIKAISN